MFDFHKYAKSRNCNCRQVQKQLFVAAVPKKRGNKEDSSQDINYLITPDALETVINRQLLEQVLRCQCGICEPRTINTPPKDDRDLANKIATKAEGRELTAALALAGGTFALRLLDKHGLDSIDATLGRLRDLHEVTHALFRPFEEHRAFETCKHRPNHNSSTNMFCLAENFTEQLSKLATIFRVPTFYANNLFQHFDHPQNMPFIEDTLLPIGNRDGGRSFYKFKIFPIFCEERLQNRSLFRKIIVLDKEEEREQATRENQVLQVLKELAHNNIAEILFAFQEEKPPRLSLVFDFHPFDLDKILFPREEDKTALPNHQLPDRDPFPGSRLNHWLWIGLLGIFDAVAALHEPPLASLQQNPKTVWVGAHFDIKPANILITDKGEFLLTDFGLTYFKNLATEREQDTNFTTTAGTLMYAPPDCYSIRKAEQAESEKRFNDQRWWRRNYDVWSLACVASELLAHLVDSKDTPTKFRTDRGGEYGSGFWTKDDNGKEVIKKAVLHRLDRYCKLPDPYLNRVAEQLQRMFSINRQNPMTVKACHGELSVAVKIDRDILQDRDDREIAGPHTYSHLKSLRTSFSTRRISSPLRCSLYLWENIPWSKIKLEVEFTGSRGETFIVPSCTNEKADEFLAISLFDPSNLYDGSKLRTNSIFLECAFRMMHDSFRFHFARRTDYYHFLGAVTHQHVMLETGSEFRFRRCKIKSKDKRPFTSFSSHSNEHEAPDGHVHILRELGDDDYQKVYVNTDTQIKTPKQSNAPMEALSRLTVNTRSHVQYRLALYLHSHDNSPPALVLISLNYKVFLPTFNHSGKPHPRLRLERLRGKDIRGTVLHAPPDLGATTDPKLASLPGVPMDPGRITRLIEKSKGFELIEIDFFDATGKQLPSDKVILTADFKISRQQKV
ncbi:hypothetical protein SLS60_007436 [Paraconiothyrium brasiliense]|uniref:Protein kinase domain-containing protein n=1 Tax=Paraconiothyrium brasiliense TaxID=300254 RepID=A0ABR3R5C6_9PLEO